MDDNSDDEPLTSQALSALKGDAADSTHMSEDSDDDLYQLVRSDNAEDSMHVEEFSPHSDARDLVRSINGMYRVLDLINEQGSGGLVDKVVIAQDSLRAFINSVCPGTHVSMT